MVDAELGPELAIVDRGGSARAVIWPGMGAELRSLHRISLQAMGRTKQLAHPSEAVYYVISGSGAICKDPESPQEALVEGSMVHVDSGPPTRSVPARRGWSWSAARRRPTQPSTSRLGGDDDVAFRVFHRDEPDQLLPMIASDARLIVWPGTGSETANMNYVRMQPGEENVPHRHRPSARTRSSSSRARARSPTSATTRCSSSRPAQVIHVPPGVEHQVRGDRGAEIVSVGGPSPADKALLRAAGVLPEE